MTAIEDECDKISEEFILKACKSFRGRVDKIIEKKKMAVILSKFTGLKQTYFIHWQEPNKYYFWSEWVWK